MLHPDEVRIDLGGEAYANFFIHSIIKVSFIPC